MLFRIKYFFASLFSSLLLLLRGRSDQGTRVFIYHSIKEKLENSDDHYTISENRFLNHLSLLIKEKVTFGRFENFKPDSNGVILTFDDGFKDNYELAIKLNERKIPVTIFVVSDFILKSIPNYLSADELKKLSSLEMVTIGAHGKTHRPLLSLARNEWEFEMQKSKEDLEKIIGKEVCVMSFPHGSYNNEMVEYALQIGYKRIGTSDIGENADPVGPLIKRTFVLEWDSANILKQKLFGLWDWMAKYK